MAEYTHPHPDPAHIMRTYRRYILSFKFKQNAQRRVYAKRVARGLTHYRGFVEQYLAAKRLVVHPGDLPQNPAPPDKTSEQP